MSLYNLIRGVHPMAGLALAAIDLRAGDLPRFRDAWFSDDGETVVVLTRTGGGNRADHSLSILAIADHPAYQSDRDDGFDSTFMHFKFRTPEDWVPDVLVLTAELVAAGKGEAVQGPQGLVDSIKKLGEGEVSLAPHKSKDPEALKAAHARLKDMAMGRGPWRD